MERRRDYVFKFKKIMIEQIKSKYSFSKTVSASLQLLLGLDDEGLVDVRDDTTTSNGSLDQGVKLFVSSDSELQVSWGDSLDFKVL